MFNKQRLESANNHPELVRPVNSTRTCNIIKTAHYEISIRFPTYKSVGKPYFHLDSKEYICSSQTLPWYIVSQWAINGKISGISDVCFQRKNLEKTNSHKEDAIELEQYPILKLFCFNRVIHQLQCKTTILFPNYRLQILIQ